VVGLKQVLGSEHAWPYALALPLIPALFGSVLLLFFFPESPKALLLALKDVEGTDNMVLARKSLQLLRNDTDVETELIQMKKELEDSSAQNSTETYTLKQLFLSAELRWPLLIAVLLNFAQQMSGVNAVNKNLQFNGF
jgi:hypothetical protein